VDEEVGLGRDEHRGDRREGLGEAVDDIGLLSAGADEAEAFVSAG
jgi:hypothetical protein